MEYLNLHVSTLDSVAFIGSEPVDQATWLKLLRYCIGQENGGIIADCRDWKDRKCQQLLRITRAEMLRGCDLWEWRGNDLHLYGYPIEQEAKVIKKRGIARTNGQQGGRPPTNPAGTDFGSDVETEIGSESGSVKEGKEKEGKESTTATAREAEALVAACPRPSPTQPALTAALACIKRHRGTFTFQQILDASKEATRLIREWPEDERLAYCPTTVRFFTEDRWRAHPDDFRSRRGARADLSQSDRRQPSHHIANGSIDIGGRTPAGVLDTTSIDDTELDFSKP